MRTAAAHAPTPVAARTSRATPRVSRLLLRNVPLFASLPDSQLGLLTELIQRKTYPRGAKILRLDEHTASLHIIVSGEVHVVFSDRRGAEVILNILKQGEYFGEMGLIDEQPRCATVIAREPCETMILSKKDFAACVKKNINLAMALHRGLVRRLRHANQKIASLAWFDVHGRVARVLLEMAENIDGRKVVRKLSQQDIAKLIGASREMVSRVLGHFQAQGHIEMVGTSIILYTRAKR